MVFGIQACGPEFILVAGTYIILALGEAGTEGSLGIVGQLAPDSGLKKK